jgi:hypothetical protein
VTEPHPVVERYMAQFETAIGGLAPQDRLEVLQEIRNHIAEAIAAGRSLDAVLESLGPADALGKAYAVELLLHPQHERRRSAAGRWFSVILLLVVLSIPTLVAVSTLGAIGISFVAAGVFAFVAGMLETVGLVHWATETDLSPALGMLAGPALVFVGLFALVALRFYIRVAVRTVRAPLQPIRTADRVR